MPRKPVVFLNQTFESQKDFEKYVKKIIYDIGVCYDVKNKHPEKYKLLIKILERHPEFSYKSENMCNIKIINDILNVKALKIIIIKTNGEIDISWRCAINGKHKSKKGVLTTAMRSSIYKQIEDFRINSKNYCCELCGSVEALQVDHNDEKKSAFDELVYNFVNENKDIKIPDNFRELNDGTHRVGFLQEDNNFENKWVEYHRQHAILRILCKNCNLRRPKTKRKLILK